MARLLRQSERWRRGNFLRRDGSSGRGSKPFGLERCDSPGWSPASRAGEWSGSLAHPLPVLLGSPHRDILAMIQFTPGLSSLQ